MPLQAIFRPAAFILVSTICAHNAFALKVRVKQADSNNRVVVASNETVAIAEGKKSNVGFSGKSAQLAVLTDDGPLSVVLAYKDGKKILPAKKVLKNPNKYCAAGGLLAYTGIKGKKGSINLRTREQGDIAYHSGKVSTGGSSSRPNALSKKSLTALVNVGSDCLPIGNGLTLGLGTGVNPTAVATKKIATDSDLDGMMDLLDIDTDDDSILNNFDDQPVLEFPNFSVFSNLKVGLEATVNINAFGRTPTKEEVDALTENTTLAIEVKASGSAQESELNCNGLSYCSTPGTGTVLNTSDAFPGLAGGAFDSDSDGNGTIAAGPTGDFQLDTNLSAFDEINPGDSYVQTVTTSATPLVQIYLASLQFVFRATPALKTLIEDPDGTPETLNFSYPISNGSAGTPSNCIEVAPNGDGDIILDMTAWRPQRKGLSALGEADYVDLGNAKISIDIPNAPGTSGGTPTAGPGLCPGSTFTTTDSNLAVISDGLQDSFGDTDANVANTINFKVNITDCLSSASLALDADEEVKLDLQFRNNVGDNAAQAFCIERP